MPLKVLNKAARQMIEWELKRRGYMIRPIGNSFKKIPLGTVPGFATLVSPILDEKRTLLGTDRLYILWQCVRNTATLEGDMAEVGVFRGGASKMILSTLQEAGRTKTMYVCDTFEGMPDLQVAVDNRRRGGFEQTSMEGVREYLRDFPNATLLKGPIEQTSHLIASTAFSFVHMDVDIYQSFKDCFSFFGPRIVPGGILLLDDYGFTSCAGAKRAGDEFAAEHKHRFHLFHLETGQALLIRFA